MKHIYTLTFIFLMVLTASNNADAQCFDDGHSPFQNQGWLSCNTSVGPIPERGDAHWLLYDFGHVYTLDSIYFWNHNVWGETGMGVKSILIDYSTDKQNWNTVGPINVEKAPGSWKYTGTQGPGLGNVNAQYVLITVVSTWDDATACAGLGEIKFSVNNTVNVTETEIAQEWSISPNPAIDRITIQLPEVDEIQDLSVYNSVGQLVQRLVIPNGPQFTIPVNEMEEGIYFVSISTKNEVFTKSFVKG
ncbi:MAG: T9SS type A sorting domain-containing protein [Bacteroidota bacterium]